MFNHKTILIAIISSVCALPILAQEPSVVVSQVRIEIVDGNTREEALRRWLSVREDYRYDDLESLDSAVQRDVQELVNRRIFLSVEGRVEPSPQDETNQVDVIYTIVDANTFVPVPLPLYDSNTGGVQLLYVQIWDNMLGTMTDWFSLTTLTVRGNGEGGLETGPWIFAPRVSNIKLGNLVYGVRFEQERVESQTYDGPTLLSDYRFDRSAFFVNTEFRLGPRRRLYYTIEPGVEFRYGYNDFAGIGGFERTEFDGRIQQSFFYDSVDVFFNSRVGYRAGVINTLRAFQRDGAWMPAADLTAEFSPYFAFGPEGRISYYARLRGLAVFGDNYERLGEFLRGIPDATMDGNLAFYVNQTIGIGLWKWRGVWDLQIHPFFDIGLAAGGSRDFSGWNDLRRSAGADVLLFIEKVPNLAFRFSWGMDLDSDVPGGDDNKTEFIVRYAYSY